MSSASRSDEGRRRASHSEEIAPVARRWPQRAMIARWPESRATNAIRSDWMRAEAPIWRP
jgi:hypothetical protein